MWHLCDQKLLINLYSIFQVQELITKYEKAEAEAEAAKKEKEKEKAQKS